jgi:hypothetical protein
MVVSKCLRTGIARSTTDAPSPCLISRLHAAALSPGREEGRNLCLSAFGLRRDPAMHGAIGYIVGMEPIKNYNWTMWTTEGASAFTLIVM